MWWLKIHSAKCRRIHWVSFRFIHFFFSCSNFNLWNMFFFVGSSQRKKNCSFETNKSWMKFFMIPSFHLWVSHEDRETFFFIHLHFKYTWYGYLLQSIFCIAWIDGYRFRAIVCTFFSIFTRIDSHFSWTISKVYNVKKRLWRLS